jgi:hypothetical protein
VNSGLRMGELAGNQVPFCEPAGAAHRSFLEASADFRVATFAGLVADIFVGRRRGGRRSGAAWGLSKQQRTETAKEADGRAGREEMSPRFAAKRLASYTGPLRKHWRLLRAIPQIANGPGANRL